MTRTICKTIAILVLIVSGSISAYAQSEKEKSDPLNHGVNIKNIPAPVLSEKAKSRGINGEIVLNVTFLATGKIGDVVVVQETPLNSWTFADMVESAIKTAKKIKFEPAVKNGEPVAVTKPVVITLNVRGR